MRGRRTRRLVVAAVLFIMMPLLTLGAGFGSLVLEDVGTIASTTRSTGDDALWLGHAWVDGRHGQADLNALTTRLRGTGIRDLFVHAGPLSDDGTLDPGLRPKARWLIEALHQALPRVKVQAWLGDIVGGGHLDLEDPATRARILAGVRQVLNDGFDGVHYDLEPVGDGDPGYLALLAATHTLTHPAGRVLSVSADQIEPMPGMRVPEQWIFSRPHWWSVEFLRQVALRVDEVAIMTYDTAMPTRAAYAGYVRRETQLAMGAVPTSVTLLIGAPAFHTHDLGHVASAETVAAAIRGVRLAISPIPPRRPLGIALYVDYTATTQDWTDYLTGWAQP